MNPHYNQNYTREQIEEVLNNIKDCVKRNRFTISKNENRQENIDFINEYNITDKKQKKILLEIEAIDFCYSLKNINPEFEHEILYVFVPQVELYNADGNLEMVDVYTKFNVVDLSNGKRTIVISFHKRNKDIDYLFR